ncbi:MAG: M24 family metallopeptidase C-terminal domain-containing protein [Bacteroidales bacterium]
MDTTAVDKSLLNTQETEWLNNYHKRVFEELEPLANDELKIYLTELTKPV